MCHPPLGRRLYFGVLLAAIGSVACRDRLAGAREQAAARPLMLVEPAAPKAPTPDPPFGDPWSDGQVLRKIPLPNLPYLAELVGAECMSGGEDYALMLVRLLKQDDESLFQELTHYGIKDSSAASGYAPPTLERYPNFSHVTTEVRDLNFDGQLDLMIGDTYAPERGVHGYSVWIFDTRSGYFTNAILPRVGKIKLDSGHREVSSNGWERDAGDTETVFSFARSPFFADVLVPE